MTARKSTTTGPVPVIDAALGAGTGRSAKVAVPLSDGVLMTAAAKAFNVRQQSLGLDTYGLRESKAALQSTAVEMVRAEVLALADALQDMAASMTAGDVECLARHDGTHVRIRRTGMTAPDRERGVFGQANVTLTLDPKSTLGAVLAKVAPREPKPEAKDNKK